MFNGQRLFQPPGALGEIRFTAGVDQRFQAGLVVLTLANSTLLPLVDVRAEAAVVKGATLAAVVIVQELRVEALLEHVEAEVAAIEPDPGMGDAQRGDATRVEEDGG